MYYMELDYQADSQTGRIYIIGCTHWIWLCVPPHENVVKSR